MMQKIAPFVHSYNAFTPLVEGVPVVLGEIQNFQSPARKATGSTTYIFLDISLFL